MSSSCSDEPVARGAYFLRSERLGLRTWRESDLELALGLWGDPQVSRLIGGPFTPEQVQERLARELDSARAHGLQYWPVFLLASGEHVGCCGLRPYRPHEGVHELGFHLRRQHQGRGYAREAAGAVVEYAFETLGAAGLFAGHHPANEPSRRLLTQLGFEYTHDELYPPTGLLHPSYRLTREAFRRLRT